MENDKQLKYQREYLKLLFAKGLGDDLAKAVKFILISLPSSSVSASQWTEMVKLFANEPPYTIEAVNRESIMFKLNYMDKKKQTSFEVFQGEFKTVHWEITNREELEPLIEILDFNQIRNLASLVPAWLTKLQKKDIMIYPSEAEVCANVEKRSLPKDHSEWFTTVPRHKWARPRLMMAC
jgi:hypothetical protein